MNRTIRALLLAAAGMVLSGAAHAAEEKGTRDEAKALVQAAAAHIKQVGPEKAYEDFGKDKATWTKKDLYLFVMDFDGDMKFHGVNEKLVGKNQMNIKDQNGKEFNKEMLAAAAAKGETWEDYEWVHPATKKVTPKSTYFMRVPGTNLGVGCGVYH